MEQMLDRIAGTKNSIGYIDDSQIGESQIDKINTITQIRLIKLNGFVEGEQ